MVITCIFFTPKKKKTLLAFDGVHKWPKVIEVFIYIGISLGLSTSLKI